eukprot:20662_1
MKYDEKDDIVEDEIQILDELQIRNVTQLSRHLASDEYRDYSLLTVMMMMIIKLTLNILEWEFKASRTKLNVLMGHIKLDKCLMNQVNIQDLVCFIHLYIKKIMMIL